MENHKPTENPSPSLSRGHRCKKHGGTGDYLTSPATPRKHVTLANHGPCCSKEANFYVESDPDSPCSTPCRRPRSRQNDESGELLIKCSSECPGHRKHSLCDRRDSGDSPRPLRHDQSDDVARPSRSKTRQPHRKPDQSPQKQKIQAIHEALDAVTDGGLGTRQYHSTSHLSELKHKEPSPGIKNRDFSMSHINNNKPLTEEELRLVPLKPRSNSSSRSASPLRTIRHHVRIERWEKITDGELNVNNMCKKFDLTGFSHNVMEVDAGEPVKTDVSPEIRKAGLVSGKVWVKMYGRRINLQAGDILEIPPNQAHKAAADDDSVVIIGQKASCCIS